MIKENHMRSGMFRFLSSRSLVATPAVALLCALSVLAHTAPKSNQTAAAAVSQPVHTSFTTPKQAAGALIQAGFAPGARLACGQAQDESFE